MPEPVPPLVVALKVWVWAMLWAATVIPVVLDPVRVGLVALLDWLITSRLVSPEDWTSANSDD